MVEIECGKKKEILLLCAFFLLPRSFISFFGGGMATHFFYHAQYFEEQDFIFLTMPFPLFISFWKGYYIGRRKHIIGELDFG